jgi:hypothetical protein
MDPKASGSPQKAARGQIKADFAVLLLSPCPKGAQNQGQMAAHAPRKVFAARAVGKNGFAGPGVVRAPPRATATAKTACTWMARPAKAKAQSSFSLL